MLSAADVVSGMLSFKQDGLWRDVRWEGGGGGWTGQFVFVEGGHVNSIIILLRSGDMSIR